MRLLLVPIFALVFAVGAAVGQWAGTVASAALPAKLDQPAKSKLELVVFESRSCSFCERFRQTIAPGYGLAHTAELAPMRFVDVASVDLDRMGLAARLDVLPTSVLMKDGREIERITGLTSPATYFVLVKHMVAKSAE